MPQRFSLHAALRVAVMACFVVCFWLRAGRFPTADEVDFVRPIEQWVQNGPATYGLWHAPFYPWFLSLFGKIFGFTMPVLRSIGFLSTLVAAFFVYRSARLVFGENVEWKSTLVLLLALLSPFALGSALTLDYDTTLLMASTALYFHFLILWDQRLAKEEFKPTPLVLAFGLALALCLMSKETTPLVYPMGLVFVLAKHLSVWRALAWSTLTGIAGVAVFAVLTWLWCAWYDLPFSAVFEMDLLGLRIHGGSNPGLQSTGVGPWLWSKSFPVFWIGVPLAAAFLVFLPGMLRSTGAVGGIAAVVFLVLLVYTFGLRQMTYYFPKYMAPVLPWLAWLVVARLPRAASPRMLFVIWALLSVYFIVAPDTLWVLYARTPKAMAWSLAVYALPFVGWLAFKCFRKEQMTSVATFAVLMSAGLSAAYTWTALRSQHEITYWYGETALGEANEQISRWRKRHPHGTIYTGIKDIAWVGKGAGARYVPMDTMKGMTDQLCAQKEPLLLITRRREESSLLMAEQLAGLRECLNIGEGVDIVWGTNESGK